MKRKAKIDWVPGSSSALHERPGFLLRRAHQIAVSIFLEETAAEGVTTTSQYGIMTILNERQNLDQAALAKLIGLDRSTTGLVISKLEAEGLIARKVGATDRRCKELHLTRKGRAFLARLEPKATAAAKRVLAALSAEDQKKFMALLIRFVEAHNAHVRIPMD